MFCPVCNKPLSNKDHLYETFENGVIGCTLCSIETEDTEGYLVLVTPEDTYDYSDYTVVFPEDFTEETDYTSDDHYDFLYHLEKEERILHRYE